MRATPLLAVLVLAGGVFAHAAGAEMIVKKSAHNVATTLDRLEAALKEKGITVVARVNHGAAAAKADMKLRPTEVLIFGNPKLGTPLMQSNQGIGLDLPLKVVAWQDDKGQSWIGYTPPAELAARHNVRDRAEVVAKMTEVLDALTGRATQK